MYKLEVVHTNMKNKKLYEYVIDIQLNYQFVKRIEIDEETKTVWFELVAIDVVTNEEFATIKSESKSDFTFEETNKSIKDLLLAIIGVEAFRENIHNKTIEELENGFKINGKEFLLECDKYAKLREKVLKEVKEYGLH